ncbi:MAG: GAF domain-containing protein [Myxococcota bacterium]
MAALPLIALVILLAGIAGAFALTLRSGEVRVGLLGLCLALLAAHQGVSLWLAWDQPLSFDVSTFGELAVVAASGAGVAVLAALWRTLDERDGAESLHWDSMEAVRLLGELAGRTGVSLDEKFEAVLKIGSRCFGLETGIISRVHKQRFEVIAIRAPEGFPVTRGAVFMLADTHCGETLVANRPVAFEHVGDPAHPAMAHRAAFGFGAYFGSAISVYGEVIGTLSFGSQKPRAQRFTATDKDLLNLMAQWVGTELERRFAAEEREARAAESGVTRGARPPRRDARLPRAIDVNTALRRAEANLRKLAGSRIRSEYHLAPDLRPAALLRVALGTLVESLAAVAVDASAGRGRLIFRTANLDCAASDPNLIPAVAPDQYVTLTIEIADSGIDAERFEEAFQTPDAAPPLDNGGDGGRLMSVASIYRLLQRSGGDLSLDVEGGRSARFTIYLPRANAATRDPTSTAGARPTASAV